MKRRQYLGALGAAAVAGLAGCTGNEVKRNVELGDNKSPVEASPFIASLRADENTLVVNHVDNQKLAGDGDRTARAEVTVLRRPDGSHSHRHIVATGGELRFSLGSQNGVFELVTNGDAADSTYTGRITFEWQGETVEPIAYELVNHVF